MTPLVEAIVATAATITATAATAAAGWMRAVYKQVERNTDRSMTNKDIQRGDPEIGEPVLKRLERLERLDDQEAEQHG